jgi:hypothetical protein
MEQGQFVTWIAALPRPGEEADARPTWVVRLVEYTDYTHAVFDVTAVRTEYGSGRQVRWRSCTGSTHLIRDTTVHSPVSGIKRRLQANLTSK